jgi:NAD(P)H-hydrate epimerase
MVCGKGNNGGDGFVAARYLVNAGASVDVITAASPNDLRGDAAVHFQPLVAMRLHILSTDTGDVLSTGRYDLIGDAVLGTGSKGQPTGTVAALLRQMRQQTEQGVPIVSVDIPSGVASDTGEATDEAVRARRTVTFALPKPGLLTFPGAELAGRVTVADIGIPHTLLEDSSIRSDLTTADVVRMLLPRRSQGRDANKGTFGTLLVIAGSAGMAGAACLTAISALRAGLGLVMLAVPESVLDTAAALAPEAVLKALPETRERTHGGPDALQTALKLSEKVDAVAIGPGMGGTEQVVSFVQQFSRQVGKPLVVDADGLNALAKAGPEMISSRQSDAPFVITPHPGEMGRLMGCDTKQVQQERLQIVRDCAAKYGVTALLKGARTLIATESGQIAFNRKGSVALATAGSGDVLTGVIGALLAIGTSGYDAARAGAYVHALSGELCEREIGASGVLATEIRDHIPQARELIYSNDPILDQL